jgi:hypothetical protein
MEHFRETGLWTPLSKERIERIKREYERIIRVAAGAVPGTLSDEIEDFCQNHFDGWEKRVEALQFSLVREVGQFYLCNSRLMDPTNAREMYLHKFLARLRRRVKTGQGFVFNKSREYLDRYVPNWLVDDAEIETLNMLEQLLITCHFR